MGAVESSGKHGLCETEEMNAQCHALARVSRLVKSFFRLGTQVDLCSAGPSRLWRRQEATEAST